MLNMDKTYCVLCAQLKSFNEVIRLYDKDERLRKMVEKLSRFNVMLSFDKVIPITVCPTCVENLDKAYQFVLDVEIAQQMLVNVFENQIKNEKCASAEDEKQILDCKSDYSFEIKEEFETLSFDDSSIITGSINIKCEYEQPDTKNINNRPPSSDILSLQYRELTWNDYLWTCAYCETQFPTLEEHRVHSMQYHQCCNAFKCNDCNIKKLHLKHFIVHVKRHRNYLKQSCYKCNSNFLFERQLHKHMQNMHAPKTEYVCLGCEREFINPDELNEHKQMFNKDKRKKSIPMELESNNSLTCVICKKTFKTKGTLNTHLLIHTERKREHICEKCGKCFLNKQNLGGHMLMHNSVRPHQCEICKSSFKTSKQLKSHVGIHNSEKPHTCDQCGRGFRLQRQLKSHKIIHTDLLPYGCSFCSKKFRFKTILNQHLRQHTGDKPYSCDICKRDFTNWPNYNKHMKRRHGLDKAKKKNTPKGIYPVNPSTGEIIKYQQTIETHEWKNQILQKIDGTKKGPPTIHMSSENISTLNIQNEKAVLEHEPS